MKLFIALYQNPEEIRDVIWYLAKDQDDADRLFSDELQNSECIDEEEVEQYSLEAVYEVQDLFHANKKYRIQVIKEEQ